MIDRGDDKNVEPPQFVRHDFSAVNSAILVDQGYNEEYLKEKKHKNVAALARTVVMVLAAIALLIIIVLLVVRMDFGTEPVPVPPQVQSNEQDTNLPMELDEPDESVVGPIVDRRYTVYDSVDYSGVGRVVTGKVFSGVAATAPYRQYCYLDLSVDGDLAPNEYVHQVLSKVENDTRIDEPGSGEEELKLCQFEFD